MISRVNPTLTRNRVQKDKVEKQRHNVHWQFMCECKKQANPKIFNFKLFELPEELVNTRKNVKDFISGSANSWKKEKMYKTIFVDFVFNSLVEYKGHKFFGWYTFFLSIHLRNIVTYIHVNQIIKVPQLQISYKSLTYSHIRCTLSTRLLL